MAPSSESDSSDESGQRLPEGSRFESTRWSLVLAAGKTSEGQAGDALESLCRIYWFPVYAFARRRGYSAHDSQDLTQDFFVKLLANNTVALADPQRGRFRTFLLTSFRNFLANEWQKTTAKKRGGEQSPLRFDFELGEATYSSRADDSTSPDKLFDRQWATTLLDLVLERLHALWIQSGKREQFDVLKAFLSGKSSELTYRQAAKRLQTTEAAAMAAASRLRRQYRELLTEEIAGTVTDPDEINDEIRALFDSLG